MLRLKCFIKIVMGVLMVTAIALLVAVGTVHIPQYKDVVLKANGSDRILLDRNEKILQELRTDLTKRRLVWRELYYFSQNLSNAVVVSEDQRFFTHFGVDPISIVRAFGVLISRNGGLQGASTISMQVTDLINPEVLEHNRPIVKKSIQHKFMQMLRGLSLDYRWSKEQILAAYLNLVHLKGEYQGVSAFSFAYFKKDPRNLDLAESVVLASLIRAPNAERQRVWRAACRLANKLQSDFDCDNKLMAPLNLVFDSKPEIEMAKSLAPHFARRLFKLVPENTLVKSTLDFELQVSVNEILSRQLLKLKSRNVQDAAAIVIDNKTGDVLAYVGSVPENSESPHVDGVISPRQVGSTLKPFIYARAIDKKVLTAGSIITDGPTAIAWENQVYRPVNYDQRFYGDVTVRTALGSSLNVPAVKTVANLGLSDTYRLLQGLQFTQLKSADVYGASVALGAVDVSLAELSNAYRAFANSGYWTPLRLYVDDQTAQQQPVQIASKGASFIISDILSDTNARTIGFGWDSPLETPYWSAVKTGTSKDLRDNWCIGFSEHYTVGVWAGNFSAKKMKNVSGVTGAGPAWREIMDTLHKNKQSRQMAMPEGEVINKTVRYASAQKPTTEYFLIGTEPEGERIIVAERSRAEFVFPANGSTLYLDPNLDSEKRALVVRISGEIPEHSVLKMNGQVLGAAERKFFIKNPSRGSHILQIVLPTDEVVRESKFQIR